MTLVVLAPAASSWPTEVIIGVVSAVIGGIVLGAIPWVRDTIVYRSVWLARTVWCLVTRSRYVLVWNDAGEHHAKILINHLRSRLQDGYRFRCIASPERLQRYPRSHRYTVAIVLIDTDVTKLASNASLATKIEEWLTKYVSKGGALIGTHDVLWRRVRATRLFDVFGGRLTHFFQHQADTSYHIRAEQSDHPLRTELPDDFQLSDGEACAGEWDASAERIYETVGRDPQPLVVAHEYPDGRCVWLNSGDYGAHGVAASVGAPQPHFVQLVTNAIRWATKATDSR